MNIRILAYIIWPKHTLTISYSYTSLYYTIYTVNYIVKSEVMKVIMLKD